MTVCLFIGGPDDGKIRDILEPPYVFNIATYPPKIAAPPTTSEVKKPHYDIEKYYHTAFQDCHKPTVYIHQSLTTGQALYKLLEAYATTGAKK